MEVQEYEPQDIHILLRSMVKKRQVNDESVKGILLEVEAHENQFSTLCKHVICEFRGAERECSITPVSSRSIKY